VTDAGPPDRSLANDRSGNGAADAAKNPAGDASDGGPTVLATVPFPGVSSFAIDSTSVYWTTAYTGADGGVAPSNGTVSKCPLAGCAGAPTVLATGQSFPRELVVGGSTLYWLDFNAGAIMSCGVDCSDNAASLYTWPQIWEGTFAVTDTQAFFTGPNGADSVLECPLSGCSNPTMFASNQPTPRDFAVAGTSLYWIDYGVALTQRKVISYSDGGVMSCPIAGCDGGPTALASGLSQPASLVVNGDAVYWVQGTAIVSCPVTGCNGAPSTVVSLPGASQGVSAIAVDATDIYFSERTSPGGTAWNVWKCPRGGCPAGPTLLSSTASGTPGPVRQIAVDATRVYFVSGDGTQILALDK
jgi:hypothetical protein